MHPRYALGTNSCQSAEDCDMLEQKETHLEGKKASDLPQKPLSNIIYFTCDMLEQT